MNSTGSFSDKEITCSVYSSFEEIAEMQQEWDVFVESVDGDIYLTYYWCRTWWEFYGTGRELRIFIYRNNNTLVGLIPVFYEKQWIGPVWLKLAKIVGSDFTMVMVNPPVKSNFAKSIFCRVFDYLVLNEGCDALWFGPISGQYDSLGQLRTSFRDNPNVTLLRESIRSPYTIFPLPETFEDYVQSLTKQQRDNLRRYLNLINKSFQMSYDIVTDKTIAIAEYNNFVQMHSKQWEAEGKLGHFNDWPLGMEFNSDLVFELAKHGRLRLIRLLADGNVVSYQLCFSFGKRWYARLPARLVGPEWDKFSLGKNGLVKIIEMAIKEGVQEIEAGAGHYDYKVKLGGVEHHLYSILVVKNRLTTRLRVSLFCKAADLLHLLYYKIWFSRLAPKLPFRRRPLWKLWIRTRL